MRFAFPFLVTLLGLSLTSCVARDPSELQLSDDATASIPPLRTDSAVYHITNTRTIHQLVISFVYTNSTGGNVYVNGCHGPHPPDLQKMVNGDWVTVFSPIVLLCAGPPTRIAPLQQYEYEYHIVASLQDGWPRSGVTPVVGTYRLVWGLFSSTSEAGALPLEQRVSNTFEIIE
jgi:hypothetical protein